MEYQFSEALYKIEPSVIQGSSSILPDPTVIPLSAGNPAPDAASPTTPCLGLSAAEAAARTLPIEALQYSVTEGYLPLRQHLLRYMKEKREVRLVITEADDILITSGADGGDGRLKKPLLNRRDAVLCGA